MLDLGIPYLGNAVVFLLAWGLSCSTDVPLDLPDLQPYHEVADQVEEEHEELEDCDSI